MNTRSLAGPSLRQTASELRPSTKPGARRTKKYSGPTIGDKQSDKGAITRTPRMVRRHTQAVPVLSIVDRSCDRYMTGVQPSWSGYR
jgi:hypothetical protein